jgi:hypothetical protein
MGQEVRNINNDEFDIGPAVIESFPTKVKGNPDRVLKVRSIDSGETFILRCPKIMDSFMSITGNYLATYNRPDQDTPVVDGRSGTEWPGKSKARRAQMRTLIYKKTEEKPRLFRVKEVEGVLVLVRSRQA